MKRFFAAVLAALCLALFPCAVGAEAPADTLAFLTGRLTDWVRGDHYRTMRDTASAMLGAPARDLTVDRVLCVNADDIGSGRLPVSLICVQGAAEYAADGGLFNELLLVADPETCTLYDATVADPAWANAGGTKEQAIFSLLNGPLCGSRYDGELLSPTETRTELGADEIAAINAALAEVYAEERAVAASDKAAAHAVSPEELATLTEALKTLVSGDAYLARKAAFENATASTARDPFVRDIIALTAEGVGPRNLTLRLLCVRLGADWAENDCGYDSMLFLMDRDSGTFLSQFDADPAWANTEGTKEQQYFYLMNGPLCSADYSGAELISPSETRTFLGAGEIAPIDAALAEICDEERAAELAGKAAAHAVSPDDLTALTEALKTFVSGDAYLARKATFENTTASNVGVPSVREIVAVTAEGLGMQELTMRLLCVRLDAAWAEDGCLSESLMFFMDRDSGAGLSQFDIDPAWANADGTQEQLLWYAVSGPFGGSDYDGGPVLIDGEMRTVLPAEDVAGVNAALAE
ncbi:MAG: hypothetical protein Q4C53_04055 [Clostridia bacterium]|nr:hypothetical protein [Clostridia bacterium]